MADVTNKDKAPKTLAEQKPADRLPGETFVEWCNRMGFDPRCTCDFGVNRVSEE